MNNLDDILTFNNITKSFGSELVLDSISFRIKKHTITTLVGPNGAGKSTIAKIMLGIDRPDSGDVIMSSKLSFGYLSQNISINPYIPISVEGLLQSYSIDDKTLDLDSEVCNFGQIKKFYKKQLNELSGGQLQKVFIAASILSRPNLLILDEPTKSLDFDHENKFYSLISNAKHHMSIFIISHDLHMVPKSSDLVICLNHHICCSGLPENFNLSSGEYSFYKHLHNHKHN
jgi:zinc transport system ATP-binding protein